MAWRDVCNRKGIGLRITSLYWLIPLGLALVLNWSSLDNQFVWDDHIQFEIALGKRPGIRDIPHILYQDLIERPSLANVNVGQGNLNYFRPVTGRTLYLDRFISGSHPYGYHRTNLILHCLNSVSVYFLALFLFSFSSSSYTLALASGALFSVYPLHGECVGWVLGRTDLVVSLFFIQSLLFYIISRRHQSQQSIYLSISLFSAYLSFLSKENSIALIFIIPLYDLIFGKDSYLSGLSRQIRKRIEQAEERISPYKWLRPKNYLLLLGVFAFYLYRRTGLLGGIGTPEVYTPENPFISIISALGYYIKLALLPYPPDPFITNQYKSAIFFYLSLITIIIWARYILRGLYKGRGVFSFLSLFALITLGPALLLIIMPVSENILSERYLYLPSVGICMLIAYGMSKISLPRLRWIVFHTILVIYSILNYQRIEVWHDDLSLWSMAVSRSPQAGITHMHLGVAYAEGQDNQRAIKELKLALKYHKLEEARLNIRGFSSKEGLMHTCNNLGVISSRMGKIEQAKKWFLQSIGYQKNIYAYYNLGILAFSHAKDREDIEKAVAYFTKVIKMNPYYADAYYFLGIAYQRLGDIDKAREYLSKTIDLSPQTKRATQARDMLKAMGN